MAARCSRPSYLFWGALGGCAAELLLQWTRVWRNDPELSWGWAIPLLIAWMVRERFRDLSPGPAPADDGSKNQLLAWVWPIAVTALLGFLPLRLLIEPFPNWPTVNWLFSLTLIALVFTLIWTTEGSARARHFLFPLLFGLASLPWPTLLSGTAMGEVRVGLAQAVAEVLNLIGKPAIATGTIIQVGAGAVGVEEACGGIRSLQAVIMLGLALGEFRRMRWTRRMLCVGMGIGLALLGNALRTGVLAWIYTSLGPARFELWHSSLGAAELIIVLTVFTWLALAWRQPPACATGPAAMVSVRIEPANGSRGRLGRALARTVLAVLLIGELGVQTWYWRGDYRSHRTVQWAAQLPKSLPSYREDIFTGNMQTMLACDAHQLGHWRDAHGRERAGYVIAWNRGQFAQYAVLLHNPDICLAATGQVRMEVNPVASVRIRGTELPFISRTFRAGARSYQVFYLAWNLSAGSPLATAGDSGIPESWFVRQWKEVAAGRRNLEARIVAVAIYGEPSAKAAEAAFRQEIGRIIG